MVQSGCLTTGSRPTLVSRAARGGARLNRNVDTMSDVLNALEVIARLQEKYGWGPGPSYFENLRVLFTSDPESFWRELDTHTWWGGAGSFADFCAEVAVSEVERRTDDRTYRKALADLAASMRDAGVVSPRAQSWADTFRQWEAHGISDNFSSSGRAASAMASTTVVVARRRAKR